MIPSELLRFVFDELTELEDAIALCLAHQVLGAVGERRVFDIFVFEGAPWAGKPIIGLDEYGTKLWDVPPHVKPYLDAPEEEDVNSEEEDSDGEPMDSYHPKREPLVRFTKRRRPISIGDLETMSCRHLSPSDAQKLARLIRLLKVESKKPGAYCNTTELVLCNLSKGEYVRGDAVVELADRTPGAKDLQGHVIQLGQVLLSQICWSTNCEARMPCDEDRLCRCPWAGDRLEVIKADDMRSGIEWEDVSDEVLEWVQELWEDVHAGMRF